MSDEETRRRLARPLAAAIGGLGLLALAAGCRGPAERTPPNLVLVCLDTVRFDTFQAPETARWTDELTPWIDRAIVLERTLSPAPWTVPALASLFTGQYPNVHGAGRFRQAVANLSTEQPSSLSTRVRTLAEVLKGKGFQTVAYVAHPWFRAGYGIERGFDSLALLPDDAAFAKAIGWLRQRQAAQGATSKRQNAPFFLYLHLMRAHGRQHQGADYVRDFVGKLDPVGRARLSGSAPSGVCTDTTTDRCARYITYASGVLDDRRLLAGMLDQLNRLRLLDRTIVVAFADHGEEFWEHEGAERARGVDPRGSYGVGHGHSLYQELLHVPLLAWHPDRRGSRSSRPTSLVDVFPTLMRWIDPRGDGSQAMDGVSIDDERSGAGRGPRVLFASSIAYGPEQAAVVSGWKKIVRHVASGELASFDLQRDPGETRPSPVEAKELAGALVKYQQMRSFADLGRPENLPTDVLEELRSLGYLQGPSGPQGR